MLISQAIFSLFFAKKKELTAIACFIQGIQLTAKFELRVPYTPDARGMLPRGNFNSNLVTHEV